MLTKWVVIAPVTSQHTALWKILSELPNKEFDLGNGVKLAETPQYLRDSPFLLSGDVVGQLKCEEIQSRKICFMKEFVDPESQSSQGDYNHPAVLLQNAREEIRIANICLWIAQPSGVGFEYILTANDAVGGLQIRSMQELPCIVPHQQDLDNRIEAKDVVLAKILNEGWAPVARDSPLGLARAVLSKALLDNWPASRYLLFWVALEALFAPTGGGEFTYRLALRLARFLESEPENTQKRFSVVKSCYRWRSNIAHGRNSSRSDPDKENIIFMQTETLLRDALKAILKEALVIETINGDEREKYLESQVIGAR